MNAEEKKNAVRQLYSEVLRKGSRDTAEKLLRKDYKQHNPQAEDGREGLLRHVADLDAMYPDRKITFLHMFADGEYVITHIRFLLAPGRTEAVGMDIFRFEGDKIAEHWDVIQEIPTQSANTNGMY